MRLGSLQLIARKRKIGNDDEMFGNTVCALDQDRALIDTMRMIANVLR